MNKRDLIKHLLMTSSAMLLPALLMGSEIHVSKSGKNSNTGRQDNPYLTISKAATAAQAGDTVIVHAGTYREWVKPPRGGTGEDARITYRAAQGENVVIKGSEQIRNWRQEGGGVWKVKLPTSFFGGYNPYALKVTGTWLTYGQWHHLGDVYLNGKALLEKQTEEEVRNLFSQPAYGLAVLTWPASDLAVLDFDGSHAESAWNAQGVDLPQSIRSSG